MKNDYLTPTQAERCQVAAVMANERLVAINAGLAPVVAKNSLYTRYGKRILDIVFALVALLLTLPLNLVIGLITYFDVGRPILFKQQRTGLNGKLFSVVKFRNMRDERNAAGELLPPNERVTHWGKFVRKTSMDELLNLINILKGEMSVIGPRPLLPEYLPRYHRRHLMRHSMRPGLECPPRERMKRAWTWQEQLDNDVWYVEHVCFWVDCKMMWHLLHFMFHGNSVRARSEAMRGFFMGYSEEGIALEWSDISNEYIAKALDKNPCRLDPEQTAKP